MPGQWSTMERTISFAATENIPFLLGFQRICNIGYLAAQVMLLTCHDIVFNRDGVGGAKNGIKGRK